MKLKIDLIKSLLAFIEESPDYPEPILSDSIKINGTDPVTIVYHLELMIEAGLVCGKAQGTSGSRYVIVNRLSWEGHEFLTNALNPTVWERLKSASRSLGSFSVGIAATVLAEFAKQHIMEAAPRISL
jgi:hypothetical protein